MKKNLKLKKKFETSCKRQKDKWSKIDRKKNKERQDRKTSGQRQTDKTVNKDRQTDRHKKCLMKAEPDARIE